MLGDSSRALDLYGLLVKLMDVNYNTSFVPFLGGRGRLGLFADVVSYFKGREAFCVFYHHL